MYGGKEDDNDNIYQVNQAKIAIAKGGLLGGPGNSEQRNFLPQAYNDFIYAIIIEEYGLIGEHLSYLFTSFFCIEASGYLNDVLMHLVLSWLGIKLYIGDTGNGKYGSKCKFISGNRCNTSTGEYGWKQFSIYLFIDRYYIKCGKKCGTTGR